MLASEKKHAINMKLPPKDNAMIIEKDIFQYISPNIVEVLKRIDKGKLETLEEIRLRSDRPLMIYTGGGEAFVGEDGKLSYSWTGSYIVNQQDVIKSLELMCENSVYAFQEEIRNGFITLKGGHRVGISGKAVLDGQNLKFIKDISSLNIRMSRQVKGCALKIMKYLISTNMEVYNTLLISPPQCGKTTMLRDISRLLGDGVASLNFNGVKVGIIDERCEIAACYKGKPQNDVGQRTDVMDGCPKQLGMALMLRSMSPQIIITDEIGSHGDFEAVMKVINAGIKLITTAHGYNISEMKSRQEVISMIDNNVFERYIVLDNSKGPGTIKEIINGSNMEVLYSVAA